jgi:hypothetical protein
MRILQTARICVIDDEPKEYLPLIHALSRLGLGCLHIDGTRVEELPDKPIAGLRLVFLDMHLGTTGDANQVAAHTASVFAKVVSQTSGPTLVVFWTKHNDYVDAFKSRLLQKWPNYLGRLVFARMEKPIPEKSIDVAQLQAAIQSFLTDNAPLDVLWDWEQAVHDAATATTSALAGLAVVRADVKPDDNEARMGTKVRSAFKFLLRLILDASAGRNATKESARKDLFLGLAPLHSDRLENNSTEAADSTAQLLLKEKPSEPTAAECAEINAMLLIAPVDEEVRRLCPGSMHTFTDGAMFQETFFQAWPDIAAKIFDPNKTQPDERMELLKLCHPILLEVSADCDYAQRKRPVPRLLTGVLVPSAVVRQIEEQGKFNPAAYIHHCATVNLQVPRGQWRPIFNSHYTFSVCQPSSLGWLQPIGRLRSGALDELRHWLAAHSNRPGYISVS